MTDPSEELKPEVAEAGAPEPARPQAWRGWVGTGARAVARVWVIGFLVAAAIVSGVALNQMFEAEQRLQTLRREPSPEAYAIVAYRQELERQLEAYRRGRTADTTPVPPPRPRLLEEIDIARARNREVSQGAADSAGGGRRAPVTPVVAAPE